MESLRHELADRLDMFPVSEWSAPLLLAVIGLLDAYGLSRQMARDAAEPVLRLLPNASLEETEAEFADQFSVGEVG